MMTGPGRLVRGFTEDRGAMVGRSMGNDRCIAEVTL